MIREPGPEAEPGRRTASVVWGYGFGFLLMAFVFLILLPDAEGPSPWDPVAFRSGILELFANLRILDELADLGIVRVADVGTGVLNVDLDLLGVSNRQFGYAPFYLAIACVALSLLLRGIRQRLLAARFGFESSRRGLLASHFVGRGMNLFFPFGPGDLAIARALDQGDGPSEPAAAVVFHNRVFEVLAILCLMLVGMVYLGWGGAVTAVLWTIVLTGAVVSLTRPLGWEDPETGKGRSRWNLLAGIRAAYHAPLFVRALRGFKSSPGALSGLLLLSLLAISLEILGYWLIKQAFSSPLDDYVLMKDLSFPAFMVATAGAAMTRVLPYTFASFGIYETVAVVMFWAEGQGFLAGITVALLDSLLLNVLTLIFFVVSLRLVAFPGLLETWRQFSRQPAIRSSG